MAEAKQAYDFYTLHKNGVDTKDIINLGPDNVKMLSPEIAYQQHGQGQDPEQFKKDYDDVSKSYLDMQRNAYVIKRIQGTSPAYIQKEEPGVSTGIGQGGKDVKWVSESHVDSKKGVYASGQLTNLKFEDQPAGTLVHDWEKRQWRLRRPDEDVSGQEVNSIFGTPDLYSSWINKQLSGLWNGSVPSVMKGAGAVVKNVGDLGEALYNGAIHGKFEANGNNPWDVAYREMLASSKGIQSYNEDFRGSMWYDFNQGVSSLLTAAAMNRLGTKAAAKILPGKFTTFDAKTGQYIANEAAGQVGKYVSLGTGSMQVMGDFYEQAKTAGIPDADIAVMAPIMGAITWWSESKYGPDWVFDAYQKAGGKKIIAKEFMEKVFDYAKKSGVKNLNEMPKSGFAKGVNSLTGALGKVFYGLKTGEGYGYDLAQGFVGEATEEGLEGIFQNGLMKGYDAAKVAYNNTLPENERQKLEKGNGLFYNKDYSLGQVWHDVTDDVPYQALMGGLTGFASNGLISGYRNIVNHFSQEGAKKNRINQALVDGKIDYIREAIRDARKNDPNWPGHGWTDGENAVSYDENGNKINQSIADLVYDQTMKDIDLMEEVYNKSGLKDPDFVRTNLGGDKSLAYSALSALTNIREGEKKLKEKTEEIEAAKAAGTYTQPASPEQDELLQIQKKIDSDKADYDEIVSGRAYSKKLKTNLVTAYGNQNTTAWEKLSTKDSKSFVDSNEVDEFNDNLKTAKINELKKIDDLNKNIASVNARHIERIDSIRNKQVDDDFFATVDELLNDVLDFGIHPNAQKDLSELLGKRYEEQAAIAEGDEESFTITPEQQQASAVAQGIQSRIQGLETRIARQPRNKFDQDAFVLDNYLPYAKDIEYLDTDDADVIKSILADEAYTKPGGKLDAMEDSIKRSKQIALVNHDIYNKIDDKHTGLTEELKLTPEQKQMIVNRAEELKGKIVKIRERSKIAVNDRAREQDRLNNVYVHNRAYVLDYAIKIAQLNDKPGVKDSLMDMQIALDKIKAQGSKDEFIIAADKAQVQLESALYEAMNKDKKLYSNIVENLVQQKRPGSGHGLETVSILRGIEFLGYDFNDIFDPKSMYGSEGYTSAYHDSFAMYFATSYLNQIKRADSNVVIKAIHDTVKEREGNVPSYEQTQVIRQSISFLVNSDNQWISDYLEMRTKFDSLFDKEEAENQIKSLINNGMYLRGFAGAGKTTTTLPIALEVYAKLTQKDGLRLFLVAPTDDLMSKLVASTENARGKNAHGQMSTVDFIAQNDNVTDGYDAVVLDEASMLDDKACDKIQKIQAKGVKIFFVGDQSQVSSVLEGDNLLPIEKRCERTMPVTVSYRNSSVDVNQLLSKYRTAIFTRNIVELPNVEYNKDETFGCKYYFKMNDIIESLKNDLNNKVPSWIIVSDEAARSKMVDQLLGQGISSTDANSAVKTIMWDFDTNNKNTAQGLENAKVYVAILQEDVTSDGSLNLDLYNRMMLTAISRVGSKKENEGFVGILDETGKGISKVGNPVNTTRITVDKEAYLSRLNSIYTDNLQSTFNPKTTQAPGVPLAANIKAVDDTDSDNVEEREFDDVVKEVDSKLLNLNLKQLVLDLVPGYYVNKKDTSEKYSRVSNLKPGKRKSSTEQNTSAARGNIIDHLFKNFMANNLQTFDDIRNSYLNNPESKQTHVFTDEFLNDLFNIFQGIKEETKGFKFYTDIKPVWGQLNKENYAGTIDLIAITPEGRKYIIDLKTSFYDRTNESSRQYKDLLNDDSIQVSAYSSLLEQSTGITVDNAVILPIQVSIVNGVYAKAIANKTDGNYTKSVNINRNLWTSAPTQFAKPRKQQKMSKNQKEQLKQDSKIAEKKSRVDRYKTRLKQLDFEDSDINKMTELEMEKIVKAGKKKIKKPIIKQVKLAPNNEKAYGQAAALYFALSKGSIPINSFSVRPGAPNVKQEDIVNHQGQADKIKLLSEWQASNRKHKVVVKYHKTLRLAATKKGTNETVSNEFKNVFAIWSDADESKAVFLGTLFGAQKRASIIPEIIDQEASYPKDGKRILAEIENGFENEKSEENRQLQINFFKGLVSLKIAAAQSPNGVVVNVNSIAPAQVVEPKNDDETPTLKQFIDIVKKYGDGVIKMSHPVQTAYKDAKGKMKAGIFAQITFLGDTEKGVGIELKTDNLRQDSKYRDIDEILNDNGIEGPEGSVGLLDSKVPIDFADIINCRAVAMIEYNRSVLRDLIKDQKGLDKFIEIEKDGKNIRVVGRNASEQFKNLIGFYKFIKNKPVIFSKMYYMPAIIHAKLQENKAEFPLDEQELLKIADRVSVNANKANPLRFPTITIDTTPTSLDNTVISPDPEIESSIPNESKADADQDDTVLPDYEDTYLKPDGSITEQRISRDKATQIVKRLLGDSIGIQFSKTLYSKYGEAVYGLARKGYIAFEDNGGVEITTPRHEVLHEIMTFILDPAYRKRLLNSAKEGMSILYNKDIESITDGQAEEYMAEEYGQTDDMPPHPVLGKVYQFLKWLKGLFINSEDYRDVLNNFYSDIEYGKYQNERFKENPNFVESTKLKKKVDYSEDSNEEYDEEEFDLDEEYGDVDERVKLFGDLYDYSANHQIFGSPEHADRWVPTIIQSIVNHMSSNRVIDKHGNHRPSKTLFETIHQIQTDLEKIAEKVYTPELSEKVKLEKITSENAISLLDNNELKAWHLNKIKEDPKILYRFIQSILKNVDIARLLSTGNINEAIQSSGIDTITKKENDLIDIAGSRNPFLELILNSIPGNVYRRNKATGRVEKVGINKSQRSNPDVIKSAIANAGTTRSGLFNIEQLHNVLLAEVNELGTNTDEHFNYSDKANAVLSFIENVTEVENCSITDPSTWSYRYIVLNKALIEKRYPALKNNTNWENQYNNARDIVNSITNAFAGTRRKNPLQVKTYMVFTKDEGLQRKFKTVKLRPSQVASIKAEFQKLSNATIFSKLDDDVVANPDFQYSLKKNVSFILNSDGVNMLVANRPFINARFSSEGIEFELDENVTEDAINRAFNILGIKLGRKAINVFWNGAKTGDTDVASYEYAFDRQRIVDILGTFLLSGKTIADTNYADNQTIISKLQTIAKENGGLELDEDTSAKLGIPAPGDFYRMMEQLSIAQSAVYPDKYKNSYFTAHNKRAYAIVFDTTFGQNFGKGKKELNESAVKNIKVDVEQIIKKYEYNRTQDDLVKYNGNFVYDAKGNVVSNNLTLTNNPSMRIHVGEMVDLNGVKNDQRGYAYGEDMTAKDVAHLHITPFLDAVLNPTRQQQLPLPGPVRSDSKQGESIYYTFPVAEIVNEQQITAKGRQMINKMLLQTFNNFKSKSEASINRWNRFFKTLNIQLNDDELQQMYNDPLFLREVLRNKIVPMFPGNDKENSLLEMIKFENSGLIENKDYIVSDGLDIGFETMFNAFVELDEEGNEKIHYRDGLFNMTNFIELQKADKIGDNAVAAKLKEICAPGYANMARKLRETGYKIPDMMQNQSFATRDKKGNWKPNPVFEAFYLLHHIVHNNVYSLALGSIGQYETTNAYYKRAKEGPGSIGEIDSTHGLPQTYRLGVMEDRDGFIHQNLLDLGLITQDDTVKGTDGLMLLAPTSAIERKEAFGGRLSPIGEGTWKFSHREYNIEKDLFRNFKSSEQRLIGEVVDLASTVGHDHLKNKNNYFEEVLKRMYAKPLYDQFVELRKQMNFDQASVALLKIIKSDEAKYRPMVNDVLSFRSASKSPVEVMNREYHKTTGEATAFEDIHVMELQYKNLRHQTNSDQESDDASMSASKQTFAFCGLLEHNIVRVEKINQAQIDKAKEMIAFIKTKIDKQAGSTYKQKLHNYLKIMLKDDLSASHDYGIIARALSQTDVSLEPSLLRRTAVMKFLKRASASMRFRSPGIRLVVQPDLFGVCEDKFGQVYTLSDIKRLSLDQQKELGLDIAPQRPMHPDRLIDSKVMPAEVVGTYIHYKSMGILKTETLNDARSIHLFDGTKINTNLMTPAQVRTYVEKNWSNIDYYKTPCVRNVYNIDGSYINNKFLDVADWLHKFRRSLLGMAIRVPGAGLNAGQPTIMVGWVVDMKSTMYGNPVKNLSDGKDYDNDQISYQSFSPLAKHETDNVILGTIYDIYTDPRNFAMTNAAISTKEEERFADRLKNKMQLNVSSYDATLQMYKANNDGKRVIDRFAIAGKLYAFGYQAYMRNPKLFPTLNFNKEARDNFGEFVNVITSKMLNLSLDNAKLLVLGVVGINPESVNPVMGMILAKDKIEFQDEQPKTKFEEIALFVSQPHIKAVFDEAQRSQSSDEPTKRISKIINSHLKDLQDILDKKDPNDILAAKRDALVRESNDETTMYRMDDTYVDDIMQAEAERLAINARANIMQQLKMVEDLKLLADFDIAGEAFMNLNTLFRPDAKGIPGKDYDRHRFLYGEYGAEFLLGCPLNEFFKDGGVSFKKKNPDWYMTKRRWMPRVDPTGFTQTYQEETERQIQMRGIVNYAEVLNALPKEKEYLKIAYEQSKNIDDNFVSTGSSFKSIMSTVLDMVGIDNFKSESQFYLFMREFERAMTSAYMNSLTIKFNSLTSSFSTTEKPFTLQTVAGRNRYKREFIGWLERFKDDASNNELIAKNPFLNEIQISAVGNKKFLSFPNKSGYSDETKASIQAAAKKLQNKKAFPFTNNGNPIAPISLYDAFVFYQLCQEDFSSGQKSFFDLLGEDAFQRPGEYFKHVLDPAIKNDSLIQMTDKNGKPFLTTWNEWLNTIFKYDVLVKTKELAQFDSKKKRTIWKAGPNPEFYKGHMTRGEFRSDEVILQWNEDGEHMPKLSVTDNSDGYEMDESVSVDAWEYVKGHKIWTQIIRNLTDKQARQLNLGGSVTLNYPKTTTFVPGRIILPGKQDGIVIDVSNSGRDITIKRDTNDTDNDNSYRLEMNDGPIVPMRSLEGGRVKTVVKSKQAVLEEIASDEQDDGMAQIAQMFLDNKFVMAKLNREGAVYFVDPALVDAKSRDKLMSEKVKHPNSIIGGMYVKSTEDMYVNPLSKEPRRNFIHELFHNILSDIFQTEYTDHPARLQFRNRADEIYAQIMEVANELNVTSDDFYGLTNAEEMVNEAWSDAEFQAFLKQIPSKINRSSIWDELVEAIRKLLSEYLGGSFADIKGTVLEDIMLETMIYTNSDDIAKNNVILQSKEFKEFRRANPEVSTDEVLDYYLRCL
jgi:hypothetical protein